MFDIRLRAYTPAGERGRVLSTLSIDSTDAESATAMMTFTTTSRVAERMEAPFVVGLEYTTGSAWSRPRNDLYIVLEDAEDAKDQTDVMEFTAQSYVGWLLSKGIHWWNVDSTDGRTRDYEMTPGKLMRQFFYEGQVATGNVQRGWAPMLTTDFTDTKDSLGQNWLPVDQIKMALDLWRSYSSFIQTWTEQGHFEWWAEGTKFRMARVGSGTDRTSSLVLGGPGFESAPARTDFKDIFSTIVLIPDGTTALHEYNAEADGRFGALETSMSLTGVSDHPTARRQAQPVMQENRAKKVELAYDWNPAAGGPMPWVDFTIGDTVTARRKSGKQPQRVIGIQVSKAEDVVSVRAVVGSKLVGLQAKIGKRVGSAGTGTIIGGSGSNLPSNPGVAPADPAAPNAVRVDSNVGSWRADGTSVSSVRVAWDAVTTSADGSPIDVNLYEVSSRLGSGTMQAETTTTSTNVLIDTWTPGVTRYISVRARSVAGKWSDFSPEIGVVPQEPGVIIPKAPTGLAVASNTAAFQTDGTAIATVTMTWTPVTLSLDNLPITIQEYELRVGLDTQRVTGATATFTVPTGRQSTVSVRALTTLGLWGDPSPTISVTGAAPTASMPTPSVPILTPGMGGVGFRWDGLSSAGAAMPAGFGRVAVDTGPSAFGPWTSYGATLSAAGGGGVTAPIGVDVFVRFRSFDTLGRIGGTSAVASAKAQGVALGDIAPDLAGSIDSIRTTFDGRNRIYTSITEPVGNSTNLAVNPLPIAPTSRGDWRGGGAASVTVMTDGTPCYQITSSGSATPYIFGATSSLPATAGETYTLRAMVEIVDDVPGATYTVRAHGNTGNVYFSSGSITIVASGAPQPIEIVSTITADVLAGNLNLSLVRVGTGASGVKLRMGRVLTAKGVYKGPYVGLHTQGDQWWVLDSTATSIVGVRVWDGAAWVPYLFVADQIVAVGSITTPLIQAGAITVDHVNASFGQDLQITSNSAVIIMVGRQDEQASSLSSLEDGVEVAQSTATGAASTAGTAQSSATAAKAAADAAAATAADVGERLDRHQTYYRFGTTGLAIGDPNTNAELRLEPDAIRMTQNNVVVSEWVGGVLVASEARVDSAVIANHQWLRYGNGRTIVRPV